MKFRTASTIAVLLIASTDGYSEGYGTASTKGSLAYPAGYSSHKNSFLLKSLQGGTYRLSLIPDFGVGGHAVTLVLVLQKPDANRDAPNVLDPTGRLHGYQPYDFAASDFINGAEKSGYGDPRLIEVRQLGMVLRVKVAEVNVERTSADSPQSLDYKFKDLILDVDVQTVTAGKASSKSKK